MPIPRQRLDATFTVHRWERGDDGAGSFVFSYTLGAQTFVEQLALPADVDVSDADGATARLLDLLAVVAGVSYFKAFAPTTVRYEGVALDEAAQAVVTAAYDHGLREYAHLNGFEIPFRTEFPPATPAAAGTPKREQSVAPGRPLLPFGGGKDSSLLASALVDRNPVLFTIGTNPYVARVADALGAELLFGSRRLDPRILRGAELGFLNGHIPVTAINSLISLVLASAIGADAVVMANERSASMDTIPGINHQYSKSLAFEGLLRTSLGAAFPDYFSALRPWGDLAIARAFATRTAMLPHFMSCNRAFVRDPLRRSSGWCGECDKCRSVFLSLAPFVDPDELTSVFGRNLLDDPDGVPGFSRLVDPSDKPFDCVADIDEARHAFWLLGETPAWRSMAVVRAMVDGGRTSPPEADTFAASGDHFVPQTLLDDLRERIFE